MKNKNCFPFASEIEEAASANRRIGPAAREHLAACADCSGAFGEHSRLRELISGLEPVTAPADFEFRLRARMAAGASRRSAGLGLRWNPWGAPALGLASALLLAVGGVATYNTGLLKGGSGSSGITSAASWKLGGSNLGWDLPVISPPDAAQGAVARVVKQTRPAQRNSNIDGGGVSESALSSAANPVLPDGFGDPNGGFEVPERRTSKIKVDEGGRMRNVSLRNVSFGSETMMESAVAGTPAGQRVW
jgi:hypothetical protein